MTDDADESTSPTFKTLIAVGILILFALIAGWFTFFAGDDRLGVEARPDEISEDLDDAGEGLKKAGEATAEAADKVAEEIEKTDVDIDIDRD